MRPQQHPKLAHLSDEHLQVLIARYYRGDKTSDLVADFRIDVRPSELFKLFSPKVLPDTLCPFCGINLWQKPRSKSSRITPVPYCPGCGHEHSENAHRRCRCRNCLQRATEIALAIEETKRHLVREAHPPLPTWESPDVAQLAARLSLRDAVFVTALFCNANFDDLCTLGRPYAKERPLAPTPELARDMLAHLANRGLIRVSDSSPLEAFEFNSDLTQVSAYYSFEVRYRLFPMLPINLVAALMRTIGSMAKDGFWSRNQGTAADDGLALWKELALHESLETFAYQGRRHNLQPPSGEKTVFDLSSAS